MSRELDYFPPPGTAFKWGSKALNYSPWVCELARQREPDLFLWPLSLTLVVDKADGAWVWHVDVIDFTHKRSSLSGSASDPFLACMEAEKVGVKKLDELLPDWVRTALANKWRPPA